MEVHLKCKSNRDEQSLEGDNLKLLRKSFYECEAAEEQ